MSSPEKKEPSSALKSNLSPSLPDDLLLSCIARVSRLYYPTLSLVSKRLRSLIDSPELYKARSLLRHTESCLYVCMDFNSDRNRRWFTLCRKPDETLTNDTRKKKKKKKKKETKKKPSGYVLAKVPMPQSPPVNVSGHGLVEVGSSINNNFYSESGCIDGMFKLELVERGIHHDMYSDFYCEIENVLYSVSVSDEAFRWYDTKENMWRVLAK